MCLLTGTKKVGIFLYEGEDGREFKNNDVSVPPYPKKETGVCLVVGTAPCWLEDFEAAFLKYPQADVCAVNDAVKLVRAKHLATAHPEKVEDFMKAHKDAHGDDCDPEVHGQWQVGRNVPRETYLWDVSLRSGSAPFAATIMAKLGYDLIIFCGCPMTGGDGYAFETDKGTPTCPRVGFTSTKDTMIRSWQAAMREAVDVIPEAKKFRSMSGKTKEIFGGIE